jgi:glycosyltransferase involved in cell wall biosynthesis
MSGAPDPPCPSVLLVVEQLRRAVPGGIGTYIRGLLSGLAELEQTGGDVVPLTLFASRARADPLEGQGRPVLTAPLPSRLATRAWDHGLLRAPRGFGVVHGTSFATPPLARAGRAALSVTVHDLAWRAYPEATTRRGRRWHEAALRRALRRADAFVTPSSRVRDELIAAGAPREAVRAIPEGCDHLPPPDRAGAATVLKASGVDGPYLLTVSTLEPRKNLHRLVDAYRIARGRGLGELTLVVAGPLGWGDGGPRAAPAEGVVPIGHIEGAVLAGLYANAAAFVYVPLAEGFGLPPLEAMAASTPVVSSAAVPSVAEAPGEPPALLVDPTDVEAIADGLVRVATDAELAEGLAARGRTFAASRRWIDTAALHLELWRSLQ